MDIELVQLVQWHLEFFVWGFDGGEKIPADPTQGLEVNVAWL